MRFVTNILSYTPHYILDAEKEKRTVNAENKDHWSVSTQALCHACIYVCTYKLWTIPNVSQNALRLNRLQKTRTDLKQKLGWIVFGRGLRLYEISIVWDSVHVVHLELLKVTLVTVELSKQRNRQRTWFNLLFHFFFYLLLSYFCFFLLCIAIFTV